MKSMQPVATRRNHQLSTVNYFAAWQKASVALVLLGVAGLLALLAAPGAWTRAEVGSTSIALGRDGLGVISYYDSTGNQLMVKHCSDLACASRSLSGFAVSNFCATAILPITT